MKIALKIVSLLIVITFLSTGLIYAQDTYKSKVDAKPMKAKYLIEFKHTPEECLSALDEIKAKDAKLLSKIEWACMSGNHTGYFITEGASEEGVLNKLPEKIKPQAHVYKLAVFTPEQIEEFHKKMNK